MSADVAARLRLLAQDHHDGRLDLAAYRALRAPLLDSLVLNTAIVASAMEITQPRGTARPAIADATTRPGKPGVSTAAVAPATTAAESSSAAASNPWLGSADGARNGGAASDAESGRSEAPKRPPLAAVAIGVALIAVAAVALWLWRAPTSSQDSQHLPAGAADHVHEFVAPFVDRGDWSDARLTSLNASLLELGGAQIATVTREAWFQRFVDELRRRLKEQQALASTPLTVDNSPLAALAVTVGIDLNSPDAAIHIAALPPPPPAESSATTAKAAEGSAKSSARHSEHASAANDVSTTPANASAPRASGEAATLRADGGVSDRASLHTSSASSGDAAAVMASMPTTGARSSTMSGSATTAVGENACRVELVGSRRPLCHDTLPAGSDAPLMALVPAGSFAMGSTATAEEQPVHRVTIREPFAISVYEVSQGEFRQFCEQTNRTCATQPWSGDDYPVVNVSWDDAHAYAEWLTSVTHHRYSLPTEAQWEYAARAGQTGLFPGGDALSPTDAHYSMVAKQTAAARRAEKFKANAFRLVHVVGNVREWVEDGWSPNLSSAPADGSAAKAMQAATRVARGGSYTDGAARLRLSMREGLPAGTRDTTTGFRIVRELP
jgi:formylglycine-generating enzyme required for sulfatase activity